MMRWMVLCLIAGCAGSVPDDGQAGADVTPSPQTLWHGRADQATESMLLHFWRGSDSYLSSTANGGADAQYWNFAEAFESVLDAVERSGGTRFTGWPEALYLAQKSRGFSRDFYDDENWMTLALLRAWDHTGSTPILDEAKTLYADIEAAWDTTCCGPNPGGIWWDRPHTQKATAANAGPVIAGVRLAARTGDASYLAFAEKVYAYWRANMVDASGQVTDHVLPSGQKVDWKFTYNQGLLIGAALALHDATGNPSYLADAELVAGFVAHDEIIATPDGPVLFDGTNAGCGGDCEQFKGILARFLGELDGVATGAWSNLLADSAASIWGRGRTSDGRFAVDWAEAPGATTSLAAESSAVSALNAYASQLGTLAAPSSNVYEAEDATLVGIGVEASHAGYSGWGYLAGWNGNGQAASFRVTRASAGSARLDFHYAAAAGNATRSVLVGGKLVARASFSSTGSWDRWADASVTVTLPAGVSTVTIAFDGTSSSFLNLDRVTVSP
jgi:predicted alpha-1,6-mannanase (GH76 family)